MTHSAHADGMSGCPDIDTLADLHAGVIDGPEASELQQHAATCEACTAVLTALDLTVADLGALPAVEIPADVAARIDHAIGVEAGTVDPASTFAPNVTAFPSRPMSAPAPASMTPASMAPASMAPASTAPVAAGPQVASLAAHREKKRLGGRSLMLAAAAAAVVGVGAVVVTQGGTDDTNNVASESSAVQQLEPNDEAPAGGARAFSSPGDVLDQGAIEDDRVSPDIAGPMAESSARNQCLAEIPDRPTTPPEAVQAGVHDGQDAYAFVFSTDEADTVLMIVVSAADCSDVLDRTEGPRN